MNLKLGEKIVCIDVEKHIDWDKLQRHNPTGLIKNEIYTSNGIFIDEDNYLLVFIKELNHAFLLSRFRKLDYKFAKKLLSNIKEQVQHETNCN